MNSLALFYILEVLFIFGFVGGGSGIFRLGEGGVGKEEREFVIFVFGVVYIFKGFNVKLIKIYRFIVVWNFFLILFEFLW